MISLTTKIIIMTVVVMITMFNSDIMVPTHFCVGEVILSKTYKYGKIKIYKLIKSVLFFYERFSYG